MPEQRWQAEDFIGLTPAVDPRRSNKFFTLTGENYLWDAIGPRSGFGNRLVTPFPLARAAHVEGFRLGLADADRCFMMTQETILEWDEYLGGYRVLYVLPPSTDQAFRWSHAYLNGYVYFAHPRCGILAMDIQTNIVQPVTSPGVPTNAIGLCVNNARIVAFDDTYEYWSGPSNGLDWTPRTGGPGFQKISNHVSGEPISISSFGAGVLVWTTFGVMKSEFTGDQVVFKHRALNTEFRPVNSFCCQQIDDSTVVILDERGLMKSQGGAPTAYAPLFNEFLIDFIRKNKLKIGQNLRLEWDNLRRLMYLSYSMSEQSAVYESAFVHYQPIDKWGQFNEEHLGILPVRFNSNDRTGDYFGFVDSGSRHRYWLDAGSRETRPQLKGTNAIPARVEVPTHGDAAGATICSSSMQIGPMESMGSAKPEGFFLPGGIIKAPAELQGLGARVVLGLLRFDLEERNDQLTEVHQVALGSGESNIAGVYAIDPSIPIPDYQTVTIDEDQGLIPQNMINCQVRIMSTIDGRTIYDSYLPILVYASRNQRYYTCQSQGLWHMLELAAREVGESFHLQSFELTATYAGKLL